MADTPSSDKDQTAEPPAPEVLKPQADGEAQSAEESASAPSPAASKPGKRLRHGTYRPSHKATFIGLAVVVVILAVNAAIIGFVLKGKSSTNSQANQGQVTISQAALDKLGVSRSPVDPSGVELVVNPNARFNGKLQVGGDVSVAGQLILNSKFTASDANLTQLEAGNTSLSQLNVNGDSTLSNLTLRKDLTIAGALRLQGLATFSQLVTVNNSLNVSGNLAVGGVLSANGFHTSSLTVDSTVIIGGHVITQGSAPGVSAGPAVGSNGTVSISGNDASGTVAVNTGVGAGNGILANITFRNKYSNIPHVVISVIGSGAGSVYIYRNSTGFSIGVNNALSAGIGYAFDYIVEQ